MPNRGACCGQTGVSLHVPDPFPVRSIPGAQIGPSGSGLSLRSTIIALLLMALEPVLF